MPTSRPFRLGFFTHLPGDAHPGEIYRRTLDLFQAAEEWGYDSGWVAQHHFQPDGGRLPSPLLYLAAVAERTSTLRLGTAVLMLGAEDPLRVAEDASVLDALSGGRVELGVGTGSDDSVLAAFGLNADDRRARYARHLERLGHALTGKSLVTGEGGPVLEPPAEALTARLWESTLRPQGGQDIGSRGHGLLLARAAFMSSDPTDVDQRRVADAYLRAFAGSAAAARGAAPRIGLSRTVFPAADRRSALAQLADGTEKYARGMVERGWFPAGLGLEDYLRRAHAHYGHPEEVAASLAADLLLPDTTELIVQVQPGAPSFDQILRVLELIAHEVVPSLRERLSHTPVPA
ncbi:LLM class flavin-dependent oxidoreductase [Streptomyces violaceusniger]|uniref:Luciferase n=1 Tax=Streptomyces violaceusniger TaxID=68280 RepID=A0A4D4LPP9_STRVO|nr:luciferase [Streptomyces violaceusniger]